MKLVFYYFYLVVIQETTVWCKVNNGSWRNILLNSILRIKHFFFPKQITTPLDIVTKLYEYFKDLDITLAGFSKKEEKQFNKFTRNVYENTKTRFGMLNYTDSQMKDEFEMDDDSLRMYHNFYNFTEVLIKNLDKIILK